MKRSFADIVREEAAENLRRLLLKLPEWADAAPSLKIPSRLNLEQCSSSATARYKAALALRISSEAAAGSSTHCDVPESLRSEATPEVRGIRPPVSTGGRRSACAVADLTGGLGADSWAFSKAFGSVLYNEMNAELAAAVESNFEALGVQNVVFRSCELAPGRAAEILGGFAPDLIFMDPARRGDSGQKVFRLGDCQPNVLELKEELLALCPNLLLKLSPMADISLLCRQLGPQVREVHCVGSGGECKELLLWLQRDWTGGVNICVSGNLGSTSDFTPILNFTPEEERGAALRLYGNGEELAGTAGLIFEPSAVTMKAGCFRLLCRRFGLTKLGKSTQLYALPGNGDYVCGDGVGAYEELRRLGKLFRIRRIVPFSGASAAALGKEFPFCEVSARNVPLSSDDLRRRMKCKSGGSVHIFAAGVDFAGAGADSVAEFGADWSGRGAAPESARYLFVTERI